MKTNKKKNRADPLQDVASLIRRTAYCDKKALPPFPNKEPNKKEANRRYRYNLKTKKIDTSETE